MNIPRVNRNRCSAVIFIITLALFCSMGIASASSGSSGGGHGETTAKGWLATDTYRVMNFVVLAVGLFIILRKPVSQLLKSRIEGIRDQLSELESKKQAAEKKLVEYDEKLTLLDQEAEKIIAEYIRQGNEARSRILQEAEKAAQRLEEQARRNIEHEFGQAKLRLQEEIMEKALKKAEEIIKAKITPKDQEKLVDEYLEKVVVS